MKCYSNDTGVYVVDISLAADQRRQEDIEKDCMSFKVIMMIRSWCLWSAEDSSPPICPDSEGVSADGAATHKFLVGTLLENSTKVY